MMYMCTCLTHDGSDCTSAVIERHAHYGHANYNIHFRFLLWQNVNFAAV